MDAIAQTDADQTRKAATGQLQQLLDQFDKANQEKDAPPKVSYNEAIEMLYKEKIERVQFVLVFGGILGFIRGAHLGKVECDGLYGEKLQSVMTVADKRRIFSDYAHDVRRIGTAMGFRTCFKYVGFFGAYTVAEIFSRKV